MTARVDFSLLDTHKDLLAPGSPRVASIRQQATSLIASVISRENLPVAKVIPLEAGMWSSVFLLAPLDVVLKFPNDVYESDFLRLAGAHGVNVPAVISAGEVEEPSLGPVYYVLLDYLPNTRNPEALFYTGQLSRSHILTLADDVGDALRALHAVRLGFIGNRDVKFNNWGELLRSRFKVDPDALSSTSVFDANLLTRFEIMLREPSYAGHSDGHLVHGDLNLGNTLVDAASFRLRAIIDPWDYLAGMAMYDLAYASLPWEYGMDYHARVLARYRTGANAFDGRAYFISLLVVAYWENRGVTAADEVRKLRDILVDYVIPHIDI